MCAGVNGGLNTKGDTEEYPQCSLSPAIWSGNIDDVLPLKWIVGQSWDDVDTVLNEDTPVSERWVHDPFQESQCKCVASLPALFISLFLFSRSISKN